MDDSLETPSLRSGSCPRGLGSPSNGSEALQRGPRLGSPRCGQSCCVARRLRSHPVVRALGVRGRLTAIGGRPGISPKRTAAVRAQKKPSARTRGWRACPRRKSSRGTPRSLGLPVDPRAWQRPAPAAAGAWVSLRSSRGLVALSLCWHRLGAIRPVGWEFWWPGARWLGGPAPGIGGGDRRAWWSVCCSTRCWCASRPP